jgi:hypothetical protein
MEPEGSSPYTQEPATCPYPEPDQSSLRPHPTTRRSILILSSHLRLGFPSGSFPQVSPQKPCVHLFFPLYVPNESWRTRTQNYVDCEIILHSTFVYKFKIFRSMSMQTVVLEIYQMYYNEPMLVGSTFRVCFICDGRERERRSDLIIWK